MNTCIRAVFDSVHYAVLMAGNTAVGLHTQDLWRDSSLGTELKAEI